ncbi:MAG TPA: cupin domain-containing protein [Candidatus Dormibacteraeota bacterium]|nr:cupin domain-containing protein [Candidatus Dormibacteraeota bacterium]
MVKIGTEIESPQTGERLIFRSTADSSHGKLFQAELIMKPGPYIVRAHIHPSQEESFVVLEGAYGYQIGNRTGVGQPGETLVCPGGVSHSQWNAGNGVLRVYYEHRPALTSAEIFFETQFGLSREGKLSPKGEIKLLQGAVLLQEVGDFIRPSSPPIALQNTLFPVLAALGRLRGYRARYQKYALPTE